MPLQETSGNLTTDAFGGGVAVVPNYIEDVFSTWLFDGTAANLTITNGIDLSTKGGLVWYKSRSAAGQNYLGDTARGSDYTINSNTTNGNNYSTTRFTSFNTTGFSLGSSGSSSGTTYASWTFRKQAKFFDVVTYTGNGSSQAVSHSLGASPGAVFIKKTSGSADWVTGFATSGSANWASVTGRLNTTDAFVTNGEFAAWSSTAVTVVNSGAGYGDVNTNGATYVMYVFASNAGGFGLTGTDNVISCGQFTQGSGDTAVTLGYEPQWVMIKKIDSGGSWDMSDNMRGMPVSGSATKTLDADLSNAESSSIYGLHTTATGFVSNGYTSGTFIYIAIRRGPMKVPTDATKVFSPSLGNGSAPAFTTGFPVDMSIRGTNSGGNKETTSRLLSTTGLYTNTTDYEFTRATNVFDYMTAWSSSTNGSNVVSWSFRRAPSFFDEVCYTGTGSAATINHNLGVAPDLIIIKNRGAGSTNWAVNVRSINTNNWVLNLEEDTARFNYALFSSAPTSTTMTFTGAQVNAASNIYVAYLFATCAGVSKVGSYTGNGTTQTINCGFTGGARFVLIKRTDDVGDWYVYDTARGMTTLTDPYLWLNSTNGESATLGSVTTVSTGFALNSTILAAINTNAATYIFLAIA